MKQLKIVVSGGGTGGHIYPALAIAQGLTDAAPVRILYMGGKNSLEERLCREAAFPFYGIEAKGLRRSVAAVGDLLVNYRGLRQARKELKDFSPDLVIGTGGFVSAPVVHAASQLKIPTMIHEQNAYPGMANRFLAQDAAAVCLTFAAAAEYFRNGAILLTGLPVRKTILETSREAARHYFSFDDTKPVLLVCGGSQGARRLNSALQESWRQILAAGWRIIHITGRLNYEDVCRAADTKGLDPASGLILLPYLDKMEYGLAVADLVVGRAGASFLAEVMCKGLPSVLVPYPYAAGDHQLMNARAMEESGAAVLLRDENCNPKTMTDTLLALFADGQKRSDMAQAALKMAKPEALDNLVEIALRITGFHSEERNNDDPI